MTTLYDIPLNHLFAYDDMAFRLLEIGDYGTAQAVRVGQKRKGNWISATPLRNNNFNPCAEVIYIGANMSVLVEI